MKLTSLIAKVNTWSDFKTVLEKCAKHEKGKAFEELTKYYLQYNPVYSTTLKNVWLHHELTPSLLKRLNLPSNDQGIDLVAETFEGTYWAIQCKYLQDEDQRLSHRAISTFVSLSTGIAENISYCLVCTTVDDYAKIYQGKTNIGFCNSDEWRKLDKAFFDWLRNTLSGKEKPLLPYLPKPHQVKALSEARQYFAKEKNSRGKLVFPCGAGKSLTGYWITRELKSKSIIVAVPSLSLVKQTLEVYLRESVAHNDKVEWLCVCSDEGIGKNDDVVIHTNEIGVPCVTNRDVIADWLRKNKRKKTIIFTTYQSGKTISDACKAAKHSFNLGIMDEAHKTVGEQDKLFSHLLFEKNIKIEQRIFMTATERRYAGASDTILSMDDVSVYGDTFAQMSFKEAIGIGILSDYKIITLFISNAEVKRLIEQNAFVKPTGKDWDKETEARTLAALIALRKAMTKFPIHHAVTFHSSIKKAVAFEQSQSQFTAAYPEFSKVQSFHVSGTMPTSVRGKIVDEFAATKKGIITNAKCLTEGIDVPNIDCVLFADPRKSTVDIVQAVGRALRTKEGKKFGYVILPVFTNSNNSSEIIESAEFKEILSTIRALASNDERIVEYFRDVSKGLSKTKADKIIQFDIDEQIAAGIDVQELTGNLHLKTWDKLAKLSWMPFEEAREFVRELGIKTTFDWAMYAKSNRKPIDIPAGPANVYKKQWLGFGNFLGNGTIATQDRIYLDFSQARKLVRNLNIKSTTEWKIFCKSNEKPNNIPTAPDQIYKNKGWMGWGDFLGNDYVKYFEKSHASFIKARKIARELGLNNLREWNVYRQNNKNDKRIPSNPQLAYKEFWKGWGDFLGNSNESLKFKKYLSFEEARDFVQNQKIGTVSQWKQFIKQNKLPIGIPKSLNLVYKNKGWNGYGDFFGTGAIAPHQMVYREFNEAKFFVQSLKLKSSTEWNKFAKTSHKPIDIPNAPHLCRQYKNDWKDWGDFLGTNIISNSNKKYKTFEDAKKFVKSLELNSFADWQRYCKSEKKPDDIPYHPERKYSKDWISFEDFIGVNYLKNFVGFEDAKKHARKLCVNTTGWRLYVKSGNKPSNIPSNPDKNYLNKGWKGWADFLGKEIKIKK